MDIFSCCTCIITFLGYSVFCLAKNINEYSGQLGETLTIVCPYQRRSDRWARKLWCKEDEAGSCQAVVSAHHYSLYGTKTRGSTTISDNGGMVTVNITNLQKDDAGIYECRTVILGDIGILQKIRVLVLEEDAEGNVSAVDKVQYSISGSQSDSQLMPFILGSSLLLCKVLVMGLLYSWWKIQQTKKVKHESLPFLSAEQALRTEDRYEEPIDFNNSEGNSDPYYINYIYRGHLDQEP